MTGLNLQLFADGANGPAAGPGGETNGGEAGAPGQQNTGETSSAQEEAQAAAVQEADRAEEFESLIKGKFKDLYDAKVKDTVIRRLKNSREIVDKYNALVPMLEMLGQKYGVDPSDAKALNAAIEEDSSYYEDEALEKGLSVEQLKYIKKIERENAKLRQEQQQQIEAMQIERIHETWDRDNEKLKEIYPSYDFDEQMQNPDFFRLISNGVPVKMAYEVLHLDEIIPAAMQYTAQQTENKIVNNIIANGRRPRENGMSGQAASEQKIDVRKLTSEQRKELARRAARGEIIVL